MKFQKGKVPGNNTQLEGTSHCKVFQQLARQMTVRNGGRHLVRYSQRWLLECALQNFSNKTQFIVITHNKLTMQESDYMYGITQEEDGVSKLVSVKFESKA